MDRLLGMEVFVKVVDSGSFARASERLQMAKATVSTIVQNLENHLGTRLLNRTTRRLSLTDDGAAYYQRSVRILSDVEETEAALAQSRAKPRGKLRVDMPISFGQYYVIPALGRFAAQYPELTVQAILNDQVTDLVEEGVDAVIRIGALTDSTLVAKKIYESRAVLVASPEFIARFGEPKTPEDLKDFNCLGLLQPGTGRLRPWTMQNGEQTYVHEPGGNFSTNNVDALVEAAVGGSGVIYLLDYILNRSLSAGLLQPVLAQWSITRPISVAYPQNRHLSAKVRVFVDFVSGLFPKVKASDMTTIVARGTQKPGT
jgi:LysR family transcriptional regulator, regulator for bpeEF and oprC